MPAAPHEVAYWTPGRCRELHDGDRKKHGGGKDGG